MHFLPAGDFDLLQHLPAGTKTYALERAPSGHLVLPCNKHREPTQEASAPRSSTEDRPSGPDTSRQPGERPHKWACVACQLGLPLFGSRASHETYHPDVPPHSKVSGECGWAPCVNAHEDHTTRTISLEPDSDENIPGVNMVSDPYAEGNQSVYSSGPGDQSGEDSSADSTYLPESAESREEEREADLQRFLASNQELGRRYIALEESIMQLGALLDQVQLAASPVEGRPVITARNPATGYVQSFLPRIHPPTHSQYQYGPQAGPRCIHCDNGQYRLQDLPCPSGIIQVGNVGLSERN